MTLTLNLKPKINPDIRRAALELVERNAVSDPALRKVYLFPSNDEIRILYVDAVTRPFSPEKGIVPRYSAAYPNQEIPFASADALIRPEEAKIVPPPHGWGDWSEAEIIWEDEREHPEDNEEDVPIRQWSPASAKVFTKPNINPAIREWALQKIEENVLYDANLQKVYLFPSEDQMRLLYVEANNPPVREGDDIAPYYFPEHSIQGTPFMLGIVVIRPEEAEVLPPPYCWADWSEAEILWEEDRANAS